AAVPASVMQRDALASHVDLVGYERVRDRQQYRSRDEEQAAVEERQPPADCRSGVSQRADQSGWQFAQNRSWRQDTHHASPFGGARLGSAAVRSRMPDRALRRDNTVAVLLRRPPYNRRGPHFDHDMALTPTIHARRPVALAALGCAVVLAACGSSSK